MTALRLDIEGLAGGWHGERVLEDVSLSVDFAQGGPFLPIMGRTGAGKSTLLSILAALKAPLAGRIRWTVRGETLDIGAAARFGPEVAAFRTRHFATLFQDRGLLPYLTIGENIALFLGWRGREGRERAAAILHDVAFAGAADRRALRPMAFPHELSGGQRQRVALAMALAADPAVLFADEPTESLDTASRAQVMAMLDGWAQGGEGTGPRALVWITHHADDPARTGATQRLVVDGTAHLHPLEPPRALARAAI